MAWTDPQTWTAGSILTAAELNEQLRDNMSYLKAVADGVDFSGVQMKRGADQNVATATPEYINFDAQVFDYGGWWDIGTPRKAIVPVTAIPTGKDAIIIFVSVRTRWDSNATGLRRVSIHINGTSVGTTNVEAVSGADTEVYMADFASVGAGDHVQIEVYQSSGGNLDMALGLASVVKYAPIAL